MYWGITSIIALMNCIPSEGLVILPLASRLKNTATSVGKRARGSGTVQLSHLQGRRRRCWLDPILGFLLLPSLLSFQIPYRPCNSTLCYKHAGGISKALLEPWGVECRVRQQWYPGIKCISGCIHDPQDNSPFFSIGATDFVGPRHAQRSVGDRRPGDEKSEPLETDGDVPDGETECAGESDDGRDGHDGGSVSKVVGQDGEADGSDELNSGLSCRYDILGREISIWYTLLSQNIAHRLTII